MVLAVAGTCLLIFGSSMERAELLKAHNRRCRGLLRLVCRIVVEGQIGRSLRVFCATR
jgi:hypothetical protein